MAESSSKRKWFIGALVAIALAALTVILLRNLEMQERSVAAALGPDAARDPFYGAAKLIRALGYRVESRRVLGDLPPPDSAIVLGAWHWSLIESRRQQLERWVEAGGRLVVTTALLDDGEFAEWSGIRGVVLEDEVDGEDQAQQPTPAWQMNEGYCEIMSRDGALAGPASWNICGWRRDGALTSDVDPRWSLATAVGIQVLGVDKGRGRIVAMNMDPLSYRQILRGQNARLLVAALGLNTGEAVIFLHTDDATPLQVLAWRHGAPVILTLLLLVAAVLWRGGVRFGPLLPAATASRRSLAEQIVGTGRFIAQYGGAVALQRAVRASVELVAARRVPGFRQMDAASRVDTVSRESGIDYRRVQAAMEWSEGSTRPDLHTALMCLEACRRIMAGRKTGR
jgi:hypothetical protein